MDCGVQAGVARARVQCLTEWGGMPVFLLVYLREDRYRMEKTQRGLPSLRLARRIEPGGTAGTQNSTEFS
jgi:hypothetical protein